MRGILIVKFFVIQVWLFSQGGFINKGNWTLKPAFNYGFILEHRATIGHLIKGYVPMAEINFVKPSGGDCLWQLENNKPDYGVNFSFIDFGNPKILGYSFSLAPFLEIPLNKIEKRSRAVFKLSWGISYITKKFDVEKNHKNIAIGSNLNAYVQFRLFWNCILNKRSSLETGLSFTHLSNGRIQVPNLGLNVVSMHLGYNFKMRDSKCDISRIDSSGKTLTRNEVIFWYSLGINDNDPPGSKKFLAHTISFNYAFNKGNRHKFSTGLDLFYEESYINELEIDGIPVESLEDKMQAGIKLGYAYNIGRISFPVEMGYYTHSHSLPNGPFFHRLAIRYTSAKSLVIQFGMKTHWAIAYHFDLGIGYRLPLGKRL